MTDEHYKYMTNQQLIDKIKQQNSDIRHLKINISALRHLRNSKSDNLYEHLFNNSRDGIYLHDLEGNFIDANKSALEMTGYDQDEIFNINFDTLIDKSQIEKIYMAIDEVLKTGSHKSPIEIRIRRKDGKFIWIEVQSSILSSDNGNVIFQGIARDISQRKKTETAMKESEEKYCILFNNIKDAIFVYTINFDNNINKFIEVNNSACKHLEYTRDEIVNNISPLDIDLPIDEYSGLDFYKTVHTSKSGREIPVEINSMVFEYKSQPTILSIVRDITKNKQLTDSLTFLASELSFSEQRQRREIAEYLHDNIGQILSLIKIKLESCYQDNQIVILKEDYDNIIQLIIKCISLTRDLTTDLRPPILYEIGLEAALEALAESLEKQNNISIDFYNDDISKPIDIDVRTIIFSAAKEILINAIKHAKASRIVIDCSKSQSSFHLDISDDGTGFLDNEINQDYSSRGFGLFNVKERIKFMGGKINIKSEVGKGTSVSIDMPI